MSLTTAIKRKRAKKISKRELARRKTQSERALGLPLPPPWEPDKASQEKEA